MMAGLGEAGKGDQGTGFAPLPEINTSIPSMQGGGKKKKNFFLSRH
jgi:hypothetical protein